MPCFKIAETEHAFCFLTIAPINPGHTLIVSKQEIDSFLDLKSPSYDELFRLARPIGRAIQKVTGCKRVGLCVQGFEVPHFHLHVMPMNSPKDQDFARARSADKESLRKMQEKLLDALA